MTIVTLDIPETVTFSAGATERPARLLVAGDYPAKKLKVTEADIDALVTNFSQPLPVKVEHIDSPLDPLGLITKLWRDGAALMGQVSFPPDIATVLTNRGIKKLSCGLLQAPDWKLLEVSLVVNPHVPSAALLSDTPDPRDVHPATKAQRLGAELVRLRQDLRRQTVDAQIAELKRTGKVIPATEALARVLLSADDAPAVTLSDGTPQAVSAAFLAYLNAQPPVVTLGELAALSSLTLSGGGSGAAGSSGATGDGAETLTADQKEWLAKSLGVDPAKVAATIQRDRSRAGERPSMKGGA